MINQVDNKKSLQDQIAKKMDLKSSLQNNTDKEVKQGPVIGNQEIGELSDIVKKLLEEQRELKSKLNERDNIIADLSKEKDPKRKNTQERERRAKSLKPQTNSKKVGSADNKSLAARRLREKHTKDKERINAIEGKIEKARLRKAEIDRETSSKAQKVKSIERPSFQSRPGSDFDPRLRKDQSKTNQDLDEFTNKEYQEEFNDLNAGKSRAIQSPGYTISSKIDELNTQSRSKRSQYEYTNEGKSAANRKVMNKYSNIKVPYDDLEIDDDIQEQPFMFSLPPDDDDNYSAYSLLGGQMYRAPMTEFDIAASEGGDQIDLLMNAYSRSNARPTNKSEFTTSVGMNHSPNYNDFYVVGKDDNSSGFYQSGNFPAASINQNNRAGNKQVEHFYSSGAQPSFRVPGVYQKELYQVPSSEHQQRIRHMSSNPLGGGQMMSNNGKMIMSPGNRVSNNIMYVPSQQHKRNPNER
jgi:myosin heavy subunit